MDSFACVVLVFSLLTVDVMCEDEECHHLEFRSALSFSGRRLINHVIRTVESVFKDFCGALCFMEPNCVSYNMEVISRSPSIAKCELNNSTHNEHPDDFKLWSNYIYRGSENACDLTPCQNNAICQAGYTDKGYRCMCAAGFTGQSCTQDVDECTAATYNCSANADCVNTHGSYNCTCKAGYTGDGHNCTDINECAVPANPCDSVPNSTCNNTNGSYICQCNDGFVKNDAICEADVCHNYQTLSDADRKYDYTTVSAKCDTTPNGWYRFQGDAGTQMATTCPPANRCDANFPGWLSDLHPTVAEGIVRRKVCFHKFGDCCRELLNIEVKNCGSYYIYKLLATRSCNSRYCGTD